MHTPDTFFNILLNLIFLIAVRSTHNAFAIDVMSTSALNDWKLQGKVVTMSFDTTRRNTGQKKEACHLFKVQLGKELL